MLTCFQFHFSSLMGNNQRPNLVADAQQETKGVSNCGTQTDSIVCADIAVQTQQTEFQVDCGTQTTDRR